MGQLPGLFIQQCGKSLRLYVLNWYDQKRVMALSLKEIRHILNKDMRMRGLWTNKSLELKGNKVRFTLPPRTAELYYSL
ncbi:hypothetical protein ACFL6D_04695 [Spirochaetota bacterium]